MNGRHAGVRPRHTEPGLQTDWHSLLRRLGPRGPRRAGALGRRRPDANPRARPSPGRPGVPLGVRGPRRPCTARGAVWRFSGYGDGRPAPVSGASCGRGIAWAAGLGSFGIRSWAGVGSECGTPWVSAPVLRPAGVPAAISPDHRANRALRRGRFRRRRCSAGGRAARWATAVVRSLGRFGLAVSAAEWRRQANALTHNLPKTGQLHCGLCDRCASATPKPGRSNATGLVNRFVDAHGGP